VVFLYDTTEMKYLIVGLGNPTQEYLGTRHNIGFRMANHLAQDLQLTFTEDRYGAIAMGRIKNKEICLLKPSTFMNLSGNAVRYWMQQLQTDTSHLLILVDELVFNFGVLKLKSSGSHGGHNGLRHISEVLRTDIYARLRCGIGNNFPRGKQIEYVLGKFTSEEEALMPYVLERSTSIIKDFCLCGIQYAMTSYNNKSLLPNE
jgi:PTH1 family peptidyl-tRNA hydrolase